MIIQKRQQVKLNKLFEETTTNNFYFKGKTLTVISVDEENGMYQLQEPITFLSLWVPVEFIDVI